MQRGQPRDHRIDVVVLVPGELAADGLRTTSEASIVDDLMGLPAPGR